MKRPTGFSEETPELPALKPARRVRSAKKDLREAKKQRISHEKRETKRFTAERRRRRRLIFLSVSAFLAFGMLIIVATFTPFMAIKNIYVFGTRTISQEEILESLKIFEGKPIATVVDRDVAAVLNDFKGVESYSIDLIPPDTLQVNIVERKPVIAILRDERVDLYDPAGVMLLNVELEEKPADVILVSSDIGPGGPEFQTLARVITLMSENMRAKVEQASVDLLTGVTLKLVSGQEIFWGDHKEAGLKEVVIEAILESLKNENVSFIDVSSPNAPVFK